MQLIHLLQNLYGNLPPPRLVNVTDISRDGDGSVVTWYDTESTIQYWYTPYAGKVYLNEESYRMFSGLITNGVDNYHGANLTYIDASHFDTSNVKTMSAMFATCPKLKRLNVSNFNLQNVTDASIMFAGIGVLESLDLSTWKNANKLATMARMFENLTYVRTLDLSSFDTTNVTTMRAAFINCGSLENIIYSDKFVNSSLKNLNVDNDTNSSFQMYSGCSANKPNWEGGTWYGSGTFLLNI